MTDSDTQGERKQMAAGNKKFNLTELLSQRSKDIAPQRQQDTAKLQKDDTINRENTMVDIYDLIPSKDNFYSVEDVQDLKQSIELLGILQPLLVTNEENGSRRILAGHRRRLAVLQLVEEGKEHFRYVPIMVKPTKNAILDRLALIMANRFREKTDWEKMTESIETEKLVQELKGQMDIPGRTRDLLAEIMETSPAQLGRYKAIYHNLIAELMTEFKAGKIGVSVIYEVSGLEKEGQLQALEVFRKNGALSLPDIKEIKRQQEKTGQTVGQAGIDMVSEQQKTQKAAQTGKNTEDKEITAKEEEMAEAAMGEQPESICETCTHNGVCVEKKTDMCMGYEKHEKAIDQQQKAERKRRKPERKKEIWISSSRYEEIISGSLTFLLLKKNSFKLGEELLLLEYSEGQQSSEALKIKVSYIWEDWAGLNDNYCIIGFQFMGNTTVAIEN